MEQTFNDLYNEQKQQSTRRLLVLSIFIETAVGVVREHLFLMREGDVLTNILANPRSAAIISLLLSLPLGLTYVVLMFDIEPLAKLLNDWFTIAGQQGEINTLGRVVVFGGLLVLPVAFALNLLSMLRRVKPEGRRLQTLRLIQFAWPLIETDCLEQSARQLCFNKRYEKTLPRCMLHPLHCLSTGCSLTNLHSDIASAPNSHAYLDPRYGYSSANCFANS
jgi:hypothetical protein